MEWVEGMDWLWLVMPADVATGPNGAGAWVRDNLTNNSAHENGLFTHPLTNVPGGTVATHYQGIISCDQNALDHLTEMEDAFPGVTMVTIPYDQPDAATAASVYGFYQLP